MAPLPRVRLRSDLIRAPKLRAPVESHERHATWLELFADLAFVGAVGQIALALADDFSWQGLLRGFFLFVPMWWAWVGNTFYLSRFDSDDLGHRALGLLQIVLVVFMAGSVGPAMGAGLAGGAAAMGFSLAYSGLRWVLVGQYWGAARSNPQFAPLGRIYMAGFSASAALWTISAFLPGPYQAVLWVVGLAVDLSVPTWPRVKDLQIKFPPNESHVPERFGLFTIIVLGEAVLAVLAASRSTAIGLAEVAAGLLGLHIAFCTWWLYFEGVKGSMARRPTTRAEVVAYQIWFYSHLLLQFGFVVLSIGFKKALSSGVLKGFSDQKAGILLLGVILVFLGLHSIYNSAYRAKTLAEFWRNSFPYWVVSFTTPILAWVLRPNALVLLGILGAGFLAHVLLTLRDVGEGRPLAGEGPGSIEE